MVTKKAGRTHSDTAIHPGKVLAEELAKRAMTQRELSRRLGRPERVVSEIVNGKRGVSIETALGLEAVLGTSADFWLGLQMTYDLALARRRRPSRGRAKPG